MCRFTLAEIFRSFVCIFVTLGEKWEFYVGKINTNIYSNPILHYSKRYDGCRKNDHAFPWICFNIKEAACFCMQQKKTERTITKIDKLCEIPYED